MICEPSIRWAGTFTHVYASSLPSFGSRGRYLVNSLKPGQAGTHRRQSHPRLWKGAFASAQQRLKISSSNSHLKQRSEGFEGGCLTPVVGIHLDSIYLGPAVSARLRSLFEGHDTSYDSSLDAVERTYHCPCSFLDNVPLGLSTPVTTVEPPATPGSTMTLSPRKGAVQLDQGEVKLR